MIQPFGNTIEMITLKGVHLREAFEYSVSNINTDDPSGRFLHVSGEFSLTHICPVDFSILINWTSPIPNLGVSFFIFILFLIEIHVSKQ